MTSTEIFHREEYLDTIEDLILTDDNVYKNNTFSLRALNDALERIYLINFWNLYQTQRVRLQMQRFDLPFNRFRIEGRLIGEKETSYYPKRYTTYIDYLFIPPELRKKYRNSKFFNTPVNQQQIADNPDIFKYNHMVFINGEYIYTTEIYALDTRTGIIIDVVSPKNDHGITLEQFKQYRAENPMVTILMVPNYNFVTLNTNQYTLNTYQDGVPFHKINGATNFTNDTMGFVSATEAMSTKIYSPAIIVDATQRKVRIDTHKLPNVKRYQMCFFTFDHIFMQHTATKDDPFFRVPSKMPCPKEQMFILVQNAGRYRFDPTIDINMYYPNIYEITGLGDGDLAHIIVFQDEDSITEIEEYKNDLKKYEEYVNMLPKYKDGTIPEMVKQYKPPTFIYSIKDYRGSVYVPETMHYKAQKLHRTIYQNPWVLAIYMDMLALPNEKFFLDMEKIDLSKRLRRNTNNERLDPDINQVAFDTPHYVFAMNRHFVTTRQYDFRIFIDGLYQNPDNYKIFPGIDFYFIYIPTNKISPTSVMEIERYKLFMIEKVGTMSSIYQPVAELDLSSARSIGYSREVYAVDVETGKYIPKKKLKIEVLYSYAVNGNRWVELPGPRNIPIENLVRVTVTDPDYLGKQIKIGIQRTTSSVHGPTYTPELANRVGDYVYTKVEINNCGGFDESNYRVFNNGRLLIPKQYDIRYTDTQGGHDVVRTACDIKTGDCFTIDHVPAQWRVVYFQAKIDEDNHKGYVDLDGKIALPISLKWYDIYLNGVRLHRKNLDIITPTRFYIQGTDCRKNLMILCRDRDPEVFHLPHRNPEFEPGDWNNTIIDDLMDDIGGLKDIIDGSKPDIDPDDSTPSIADNIIGNIDAMIFFYEWLLYSFLNANWQQITQAVKDTFPMLLDEYNIMHIDANENCVPIDKYNGMIVKLIECNVRSEKDMFTDPGVDYGELGILHDRFAIRPLDTSNYEYGLPNEFLVDPNTGEPAIMNEDGTVTAIATMVRIKQFIEEFNNNIVRYNMGRADIYQITFDEEFKVFKYDDGNLLTQEITTDNSSIKKFCMALDVTFLRKVGESRMLKIADVDPVIDVHYTIKGVKKNLSCKLSRLQQNPVTVPDCAVTFTGIYMDLKYIPEETRIFVHSILLAY